MTLSSSQYSYHEEWEHLWTHSSRILGGASRRRCRAWTNAQTKEMDTYHSQGDYRYQFIPISRETPFSDDSSPCLRVTMANLRIQVQEERKTDCVPTMLASFHLYLLVRSLER